jgi:hypothetical protein
MERDYVLREAAMLGLDLLRGDESLPHESALPMKIQTPQGPKAERIVA